MAAADPPNIAARCDGTARAASSIAGNSGTGGNAPPTALTASKSASPRRRYTFGTTTLPHTRTISARSAAAVAGSPHLAFNTRSNHANTGGSTR